MCGVCISNWLRLITILMIIIWIVGFTCMYIESMSFAYSYLVFSIFNLNRPVKLISLYTLNVGWHAYIY